MSREPSRADRENLRRWMGRAPVGGTLTFQRADTKRIVTIRADRLDPILLLHSLRRHASRAGYGAQWYGEIRQRAISPVHLPEDIR